MVLVIDNYDSFTYNLVQYLGELGAEVRVRRNDHVSVDEVAEMTPEHIVISPGPGRPEDAGVSMDVIRRFGPSTARPSAIRGSASSTTGTRRRSRASVTATACGRRVVDRSSRSMRAIFVM